MKRIVSFLFLLAFSGAVMGQDTAENEPAKIVVTPSSLSLEVGEKANLSAKVLDSSGREMDIDVVFFSRSRRNVGVTPAGLVEAYRPGDVTVIALVPTDPEDEPRRAEARIQQEITVAVPNPPIESIKIKVPATRFYADSILRLEAEVKDKAGFDRSSAPRQYSVSDPSVASVNRFGQLSLLKPGNATVTLTVEEATDTLPLRVEANPVTSLELTSNMESGRTGDVIHFTAVAKDRRGNAVEEMPVQFSVYGQTDPAIIAAGAAAQVAPDGRFVAERPGHFTVVSTAGNQVAQHTIEITSRNARRKVEVVGHGAVRDRRTSDLWVWEGTDGRDYAITGTWGADGHAYFWDVTDPQHMTVVDIVRVDARTVNDVKVSEDGKIAVISREGASSRKNGFVVLDVSDIQNGVSIISRFDDQLTGGVHNVFIADNHVYALSAGRRYDIINIEDPRKPTRVGRFELDTPGHSIHDVWVSEGIAYSSNWTDGVVAVDVGGGGKGGSPNRPIKLGSYAYPSGWNHAAYPYRSKSTGKLYAFAGDESFPYGGVGQTRKGGEPMRAAGWIHVIEWDDWDNPREVARYQVPEAGTHNLWVEDDILYIGYYNGGLRVVDVSGELMGDLYKQGREIAFWVPFDPEGYSPNAPFTWGPQPFKGNIFFADWNSGLWAVKLGEPEATTARGRPRLGEPQ